MYVRIVSLGSNWWSAHSKDVTDPFCFRRGAAWFNSAGLKFGNRLRLCWIFPGQVRFNSSSGFHPEFPTRILGQTFECNQPQQWHDRTHLLITRSLARSEDPERFLVTLTERLCGPMPFDKPHWKSNGVQLISASRRHGRYEVMALMGESDWIESYIGSWMLSQDRTRLVLSGGRR